MTLEQIKRRFEKAVGIVDFNLSDNDIIQIYQRLKEVHPSELSEGTLQRIVTSVTGLDSFLITEALDNSDINDIINQIEDALKNKK